MNALLFALLYFLVNFKDFIFRCISRWTVLNLLVKWNPKWTWGLGVISRPVAIYWRNSLVLWSEVTDQRKPFLRFILSRTAAWHGPATVREGATISGLAKCSLSDRYMLLFWKPLVKEFRGALPEKVAFISAESGGGGRWWTDAFPLLLLAGKVLASCRGLPPNPREWM